MIKSIKTLGLFALLFGFFWSCVSLKENALYKEVPNPNDSVFHASSEIYSDYMTSEVWFSKSDPCLSVNTTEAAAYRGELGLHFTWDKNAIGCPWLGFGVGWDNWTGKDLSEIKNTGAIEFYVRMVEGKRGGLPWAVSLEDFSGSQAWLGVSDNAVKGEAITTEWVRVELPLSEFNWDEQEADPSNIKQFIIQFEADGEVFIDEIRIVEYKGGFRKRYPIKVLGPNEFSVDGSMEDPFWSWEAALLKEDEVRLGIEDNQLCIAAKVMDKTPLRNLNVNRDIYNGDALELAFSTEIGVNARRTNYRSTDQHIGIGLGDSIIVWDWREESAISTAQVKTKEVEGGYVVEAKIPFSSLGVTPFSIGELYGLEIAIDHGDGKGRTHQLRWNNPSVDGFHENPSLWGEVISDSKAEVTP